MQHNEEETIAQLQAQLIYRAVCCRLWLPPAYDGACHTPRLRRLRACAPKSKTRPCGGGKTRAGKFELYVSNESYHTYI